MGISSRMTAGTALLGIRPGAFQHTATVSLHRLNITLRDHSTTARLGRGLMQGRRAAGLGGSRALGWRWRIGAVRHGDGGEKLEQVVERVAMGGGDSGGDGRGGFYNGGGGGGDSDDARRTSPLSLWSRYTELLEKHPLLVKSLTAALLNAIADFACQVLVERTHSVDVRRLLSFVAIGFCMSGPGLHYWYGTLSRFITVPGLGGVVLRTAADQLVFTPLGVVGFFVAMLTLEGRQGELADRLQKDAMEIVIANWKVWIPFQIVNFGVVPPQLQVAAAGILGMVWSVFISYKGHT